MAQPAVRAALSSQPNGRRTQRGLNTIMMAAPARDGSAMQESIVVSVRGPVNLSLSGREAWGAGRL
jgi:hypothetical protein